MGQPRNHAVPGAITFAIAAKWTHHGVPLAPIAAMAATHFAEAVHATAQLGREN